MTITLHWTSTNSQSTSTANRNNPAIHTLHCAQYTEKTADKLQQAIGLIVDKATSLLHININDHSMYLLFGWHSQAAKLSIVVTDSSKTRDSEHIVQCDFTKIAALMQNKHLQTHQSSSDSDIAKQR